MLDSQTQCGNCDSTVPEHEICVCPSCEGPICPNCRCRFCDPWDAERQQRLREPNPTPEDIRLACEIIQAGWSDEERLSRIVGKPNQKERIAGVGRYEIPEVKTPSLK